MKRNYKRTENNNNNNIFICTNLEEITMIFREKRGKKRKQCVSGYRLPVIAKWANRDG